MPFLLTIRHTSRSEQDHFAEDQVVRFDAARVRVGSGADCEQVLEDEQIPSLAFSIVTERNRVTLEAAAGIKLQVNDEEAASRRELLSGDELRLGEWTFLLHKVYGEIGDRQRRNGLALFARALAVVILLAELSIVVWLPRQVRAAADRGTQLARLRTSSLLDALRSQTRDQMKDTRDAPDKLVHSALTAVGEELDLRAQYLRRHLNKLSPEQCRNMYDDLEALRVVIDDLTTGDPMQPIPDVDVDAAVKAALQRAGWQASKP